VAQHPPDLILLDLMMPGLDGYQVTKQLKRNRATRNIAIIIISALYDRSAKMLALTAGAEDFLTKPVERAELCITVRNLLHLKAHGDFHHKYGQMHQGEAASRTVDLIDASAVPIRGRQGGPPR
jgi:DNA-binding response OmpR family regulator